MAPASARLPPRSGDASEQPVVADRKRPFPDFPPTRRAVGREKDEFGLADEVLGRDVADRRKHAAVLRIVAVVAHREIMIGRHVVDRRVVERPVLAAAVREFLDDAVFEGGTAGGARAGFPEALPSSEWTGLLFVALRGRP